MKIILFVIILQPQVIQFVGKEPITFLEVKSAISQELDSMAACQAAQVLWDRMGKDGAFAAITSCSPKSVAKLEKLPPVKGTF